MSIFRRKRDPQVDEADEADETSVATDEVADDASAEAPEPGSEDREPAGPSEPSGPSEPADRSRGPFDASEVDDDLDRLDLGALLVAPLPDTELRLEVEQETQQLVSVMAVRGSSQVQLSAFAAPRSSGIWDDIREEISDSVLSSGGTAQTQTGPFGTELLARIPSQGPDGRTVFAPARFVGIDGPRWFLRAVLYGPAARADEAAEPLLELVRNLVVVRGDAAMAPREMLALRVPQAPESEASDAAEDEQDDEAGTTSRSRDDLKPFERGPEITEVR